MTAHDHRVVRSECCGNAVAFGLILDDGIMVIDGDAVEKLRRDLIDRRNPGIGQRAQGRRIGRMQVQHAACARQSRVNAAMNEPGRQVRRIGARHGLSVATVDE